MKLLAMLLLFMMAAGSPATAEDVAGGPTRLLAGAMLAIDWDTGDLYAIWAEDGTHQKLGSTGVRFIGALAMSREGALYGFTEDPDRTLYRIFVTGTGVTAEPVARLDTSYPIFEGALAFAPDGTGYLVNAGVGVDTQLATIDVATGRVETLGKLEGLQHDVNGLSWRSDGMLVGHDRPSGSLLVIDPSNRQVRTLARLPVASVGFVGGMTVVDRVAYFATAGPRAPIRGSNELYRFDPYTGRITLVMGLDAITRGTGISGLSRAVVDY